MKIAARLLLLFLLVAALPLAMFGYFSMQREEVTLRTEVLRRLSGLADKKAFQVKEYLAERVDDVRLAVRDPQVAQAMAALQKAYVQGRSGGQYAREDAATHRHFERYVKEERLFYDVFLITLQGDIVYSQNHEADFATNLLHGPYRESQLAWAFRAVRLTLEPVISGYEYYAPTGAPALFIAVPVMADGKFRGILAVQLGNELLYRVATDATGLGQSGEVTFAQRAGDSVLYTTPLKYGPDATMKFSLTLQQLRSSPMFGALSGESGSGMRTDYRGEPVVAAWRYLPELNWGLVVKIDADEVFAPIAEERVLLLEVLLGLLLFAALVAYYAGRQISVPLAEMSRTAEAVSRGNLDQRADEFAPGELGLFAQAFNSMAANLQEIYRTLESRVEERTRELNLSNEQLQQEIAERERAEEAARRLNAELERRVAERTAQFEAANRELEEFSYSMSHDMRTPLRALDGYSEMLLEDHGASLNGEGKRLLKVLRDNAQRMGRLIDDILHFLGTGRRKMHFGPLDLAQLAAEVVAELQAKAGGRRMRVEIGTLPPVTGDRDMMREVLHNLLSNSIKFSPPGNEVSIEIKGEPREGENVYSVRDHGVGFDMRYTGKLFKVFERVHATGQYEGSGIGLALVKRIVTRHGGRVWAEGKVNEGATFYFALPATAVEPEEEGGNSAGGRQPERRRSGRIRVE